jgi:hypothetical protein
MYLSWSNSIRHGRSINGGEIPTSEENAEYGYGAKKIVFILYGNQTPDIQYTGNHINYGWANTIQNERQWNCSKRFQIRNQHF